MCWRVERKGWCVDYDWVVCVCGVMVDVGGGLRCEKIVEGVIEGEEKCGDIDGVGCEVGFWVVGVGLWIVEVGFEED